MKVYLHAAYLAICNYFIINVLIQIMYFIDDKTLSVEKFASLIYR